MHAALLLSLSFSFSLSLFILLCLYPEKIEEVKDNGKGVSSKNKLSYDKQRTNARLLRAKALKQARERRDDHKKKRHSLFLAGKSPSLKEIFVPPVYNVGSDKGKVKENRFQKPWSRAIEVCTLSLSLSLILK